jgi:hypothetical protein
VGVSVLVSVGVLAVMFTGIVTPNPTPLWNNRNAKLRVPDAGETATRDQPQPIPGAVGLQTSKVKLVVSSTNI